MSTSIEEESTLTTTVITKNPMTLHATATAPSEKQPGAVSDEFELTQAEYIDLVKEAQAHPSPEAEANLARWLQASLARCRSMDCCGS